MCIERMFSGLGVATKMYTRLWCRPSTQAGEEK